MILQVGPPGQMVSEFRIRISIETACPNGLGFWVYRILGLGMYLGSSQWSQSLLIRLTHEMDFLKPVLISSGSDRGSSSSGDGDSKH